MRFIHRISIASSPEIQAELASMGIIARADGLASFDVDETDESWQQVRSWITERRPVDIVSTQFSPVELASASWLELMPTWHHGYPQPNEGSYGYRQATYDISQYCPQCGIGLIQKAPFQMKTEPRWGRNSILQLNWVFDEYFVTPEVWKKICEPHGIGYREVLNTKGIALTTVVQLVVHQEIDIETDGLAMERCPSCGRVKYIPMTRGNFPALLDAPIGHITKTKQYFGSGASASKRVLISQQLASAFRTENIRGASLRPVAEL